MMRKVKNHILSQLNLLDGNKHDYDLRNTNDFTLPRTPDMGPTLIWSISLTNRVRGAHAYCKLRTKFFSADLRPNRGSARAISQRQKTRISNFENGPRKQD